MDLRSNSKAGLAALFCLTTAIVGFGWNRGGVYSDLLPAGLISRWGSGVADLFVGETPDPGAVTAPYPAFRGPARPGVRRGPGGKAAEEEGRQKTSEIVGEVEGRPDLLVRYRALLALDPLIDETNTKVAIYHISRLAPEYNLDPDVVLAIGFVESRFTNLFGPSGDYGVMQVNYRIWQGEIEMTIADLIDIERNVAIACQILSRYRFRWGPEYISAYSGFKARYAGRVQWALAHISRHVEAEGAGRAS